MSTSKPPYPEVSQVSMSALLPMSPSLSAARVTCSSSSFVHATLAAKTLACSAIRPVLSCSLQLAPDEAHKSDEMRY